MSTPALNPPPKIVQIFSGCRAGRGLGELRHVPHFGDEVYPYVAEGTYGLGENGEVYALVESRIHPGHRGPLWVRLEIPLIDEVIR